MPSPLFSNLCPGCFADKGESAVCPHCGYDESAPRGVLVLPHRTVLNNQYLIGCTLGKLGGFGITYLAWDIHLETPVAIKEYLPRDLAGRDSNHLTITAHSKEDQALFLVGLGLFLREARTLAKFDHENIVRVRNVLEENGTAYLVMNFYEGTTLAAHLEQKGGRVPEKTALSIMLPILDGLRDVHSKGFLHRDIKPQNIYLTKTGIPILLDFGSARMVMGERTRSMTVLMTPGYAPFEQYHRKGLQGPWTDIYSCGATLYHMLTGIVPVEATERAERDTLLSPSSLVPEISPAVSSIVMQAMAMNRDARPSSVAELMDAFENAKQNRLSPIEIKKPEAKPPERKIISAENLVTQPEPQEQTLAPYFKAGLGKGNLGYYLTRFAKFDLHWSELLKPSWNTAGFLFNAFWLLYRRIFGFGVLIFAMPLLLMTITNNKLIGLYSWLILSLIIGFYGNALYYLTISNRVSRLEQYFPGSRLNPLKLSRLAAAGQASLRIPIIYFFIALIAIYSHGEFRQWLSEKAAKTAHLPAKPKLATQPQAVPQYPRDDLPNENAEIKSAYDATLYKEKADELQKSSDWWALLELSQKWCSLDRINPDAWLAFGLANFELAQYSLAQPAFETYFRLKPEENDEVLGYLTKTYIKLKKKIPAERALLKIIALRSKFNRPKSSDDAFYYNELANIYFSSNDRKREALQLYRQALATEPNNELYKVNVSAALKVVAQLSGGTLADKSTTDSHAINPNDGLNDANDWFSENYSSTTKSKSYGSLSNAAAVGDIQTVQLLINKGADINKMEMGSYPLIQAVKHRQNEMVAFLLKNGANINAEDNNGNKAILYSIANGDKQSIDILTNAGAFNSDR